VFIELFSALTRPAAAPTLPTNVSSDTKGMIAIVNDIPAALDIRKEMGTIVFIRIYSTSN
jgi:hypothetical protein